MSLHEPRPRNSSVRSQTAGQGHRVLQVDKFLRRFGGAAGYMLDLGDLLRSRGHQVEYFSADHPDNLPSTYQELFPHVEEYDPPPDGLSARVRSAASMFWSLRAEQSMEAVLDDFRPDVVHLHNIYHQLSPSILKPIQARGIPMVMTLHDFKLVCPTYRFHDGRAPCEACLGGGFHHAVIRRCKSGSVINSAVVASETAFHRLIGAYEPVDRFICPSRFLFEKLVQGGYRSSHLIHIPNFTGVPVATDPPTQGTAVLSVGRLSQEKGIDTLIRACAIPPARRLRIAGDGPLSDELRSLANRLAPATTAFLGQLDSESVLTEIDTARVVAFPARGYENMPLAIIEAMARGVPVVVTDIGGSPELVSGERTGMCAPPDDPISLRRAIDRLDDDALATRLGRAGIDVVQKKYSPDVHVTQIEGLYEQLVSAPPQLQHQGARWRSRPGSRRTRVSRVAIR